MTLWGRRALDDWWDLNEDGRMAAAAQASHVEKDSIPSFARSRGRMA